MAKKKAAEEVEVITRGAWCKGDFDMEAKARAWAKARAENRASDATEIEREFFDKGLGVSEAQPGIVVVARLFRDPSKKPESSTIGGPRTA